MVSRHLSVLALALSILLMGSSSSVAQKSKDTLRIAISDFLETLSPYDRPFDEASQFSGVVYQTLVVRNEHTQKLVPQLAKSWRRIDDTTLEFELRDDIAFHSGNPFTADDIVHTVNWASDPKVKLPRKGGYTWVEKAEKLGPYKLRIYSKKPYSLDLAQLAYRFFILDSKIHKSLEHKEDYGRKFASGTGPYKMTSLERNEGLLVERFDGFKGDDKLYRTPIGRIRGIPIPDAQTRIAQLLVGDVDVIRNPTADTAKELRDNENIDVSIQPSGTYMYVQFDSIARSGFKPLQDLRVRKAIVMAVNREEISKNFIAGGEKVDLVNAICMKRNPGCRWTKDPYPYDPVAAKKLLAEAGYPDGLDLPFSVHSPYKSAAEAVAGQLREIGIRASVEPLTISVYFKKRGAGDLPVFMGIRPTGSFPQTRSIFDSYFAGNRDYWKDAEILAAMKRSDAEFDEERRAEILQPALDRINEQAYVLPIAALPTVYAHRSSVRVEASPVSATTTHIQDFFWN